MEKKKIGVIITIFVLIIIIAVNSIAATGTATVGSLRVREKPSTSSEIVEIIGAGQKVEILGIEGDWYKVKFNNVVGYVSKTYISTTDVISTDIANSTTTTTERETTTETSKTQDITTTTTTDTSSQLKSENLSQKTVTISKDVELSLVPSLFSTKVTTLKANSSVNVKYDFGNWIKVESNGQEGWITKSAISIESANTPVATPNTPVQTPTETISTSKGVINVSSAVVRNGASKTSKQIDSLSKNVEVDILGEDGDWYHIKKGSLDGYIAKHLVTKK